MIKKKRLTIVTLCMVVLLGTLQLAGCMSARMSADYPFYADENSLFEKSDIIITGEVVKVNKPTKINLRVYNKGEVASEEDKTLVTVSDIKVIDVIKGNVKVGDIVQVKQLGDKNGMAEESELKYDGYFMKDCQYILFLMDFNDLIPGIPYSTLSPIQGQINIEAGKTKVNEINPLYKTGIPKDEFVAGLKSRMASMNQ